MTEQISATDIMAAMELLKASAGNMTPELKLEFDAMNAAGYSEMSPDRRSQLHKLKVAKLIAGLNAKGIKLFKAVDQFYRDTGDEMSIRLTVAREKDSKGVWQYRFPSLPSKKADEVWLPGGKDLVFTFKGVSHVNTYLKDGVLKTSRGSKAACESLCKAIGKSTSGSTASTSIKRELEKTDDEGNPGGTSQFRTQLEDCWIQHPSINGGKAQELTEYFLALDGLDEPEQEEEAEDESGN